MAFSQRVICIEDPDIITTLKAFMSSLSHKRVFHVRYITATSYRPFPRAQTLQIPKLLLYKCNYLQGLRIMRFSILSRNFRYRNFIIIFFFTKYIAIPFFEVFIISKKFFFSIIIFLFVICFPIMFYKISIGSLRDSLAFYSFSYFSLKFNYG